MVNHEGTAAGQQGLQQFRQVFTISVHLDMPSKCAHPRKQSLPVWRGKVGQL